MRRISTSRERKESPKPPNHFCFLVRMCHMANPPPRSAKLRAFATRSVIIFELVKRSNEFGVSNQRKKEGLGFRDSTKVRLAERDRWDLNPRPSGLPAVGSAGARCPILIVLAGQNRSLAGDLDYGPSLRLGTDSK